MTDRERKEMVWWLDEFSAGDQADKYLELFPEMNERLWKYAVGVFIWNMSGEIDISNPDDVSRVRHILRTIGSTPAFYFFDNVFNECSPDVVSEILGIIPKKPRKEPSLLANFQVFAIDSWEKAKHFQDQASWPMIISKEAFNSFTANGDLLCLCGNGEWWEVPCQPGEKFPYDQYGYSLIAVELSSANEIISVSSRWNTFTNDEGHFLTSAQLRKLLGETEFAKLLTHEAKIQ